MFLRVHIGYGMISQPMFFIKYIIYNVFAELSVFIKIWATQDEVIERYALC